VKEPNQFWACWLREPLLFLSQFMCRLTSRIPDAGFRKKHSEPSLNAFNPRALTDFFGTRFNPRSGDRRLELSINYLIHQLHLSGIRRQRQEENREDCVCPS
jgi:hypothetical protein